jgi:hypothetical protein
MADGVAAHFGAPSSHSPTAAPAELKHKVGGSVDAVATSYEHQF